MGVMTMSDIQSDQLKKEACNNCIERLRDVLTDGKLKEFEEAFYKEVDRVVFTGRRNG